MRRLLAIAAALAALVAAGGCGETNTTADETPAVTAHDDGAAAAAQARREARERRQARAAARARAERRAKRREARRHARARARARARAEARRQAAAQAEPEPEPVSNCDPNYEGACLDPDASDYDCAGGSGDGPEYTGPVRVVGYDSYDLDRDGDGYACE